jgi:hypothetical protein
MSEARHTPGPLFVSVENLWPFNIVTKNADGEMVFSNRMPCYSTEHKNAAEAISGKDMNPEWEAEKHNRRAIADEVLRAAAPELLDACKSAMPKGICLTNKNIPDSTVIPVDFTVGELRKIAAAIAKATWATT